VSKNDESKLFLLIIWNKKNKLFFLYMGDREYHLFVVIPIQVFFLLTSEIVVRGILFK
jgi:hypothetical protein